MRTLATRLLCSAAASLLLPVAWAVPTGDLKENYQPIIERNPFGLKPPPPPAPPPTNKPPEVKPKKEIFLTGITTIGFPRIPKQAYIMTKEQGKKDPDYYALTEEQGRDGLTVLHIDEVNRKVKVKTDEGEVLLSFATHAIPTPAAPVAAPGGRPVPGQPGAIPAPGQNVAARPGQPGGIPSPPGAAQTAVYNPSAPPPAESLQTASGGSQSMYQNMTGGYAQTRQIPSRNVRVRTPAMDNMAGAGGGPEQMMEQPIDPAMQYLQMKAHEQQSIQQGIPTPPLPPIPD